MKRTSGSVLALSLAAFVAASASAREVFIVDSEEIGGTRSASEGGSEVFRLLDDAIEADGDFDDFFGVDQRIRLDYAGLADAAVIDVSADGRTAVVSLRGVGFTRTFRAQDREELGDEIADFFEEEGSDVYAAFLAYLREQTFIGAVDGNPDAATALLATGSFRRHALPGPEALGGNRSLSFQLDEDRIGWVRFTGTGGYVDSDGFDGSSFTGTLDGGVQFSDWVGLTGAYTFGYRDAGGADLYQSGLEIGVPVTLLGRRPAPLTENAVSFKLVPVLHFGSASSADTGDLGAFVGGGLNAAGGLRIGDLTFTVGAGLMGYEGIKQSFLDYDDDGDEDQRGPFHSDGIDRDELDTDLSQAVVSLGGGVLWRPGTPGNAFSLDAGLAHHRFLGDAAVEGWWTPTAGVSLTGEQTTFRLGYEGDFADDVEEYEGHRVRASFTFSF